jgi:integrase
MKRGKATRYPGVFRMDDDSLMIRAKVTDPRTGYQKEVTRKLETTSLPEAARARAELIDGVRNPVGTTKKIRVGDFARSWIESKALRLDATTLKTYVDALENHVLPALGNFYYDALTPMDVQRWIDDSIRRGWTSERRVSRGKKRNAKAARRAYSRGAVAVWFRVFRTMTRDAIVALELPRDPTLRISLPERSREPDEGNALSPEELQKFMAAMREKYPHHYPLLATLAYTGLRFCHASALRWEDWDEQAGVLRIKRKQVNAKVGPVTRKKRAPNEYPVPPELAAILDAHRRDLKKAKEVEHALPELTWMFPSTAGTLRTPNTMDRAWAKCLEIAGISKRFTLHGLRYTFTDLVRLANVDAVVRRALTGHVTEEMQRHYSTVGMEEKRAAIAGVLRVLDGGLSKSGTNGGTEPEAKGHPTSRGSISQPRPAVNSNTSLERDTGFEPATFSLGS